jgi:hypothetical protein
MPPLLPLPPSSRVGLAAAHRSAVAAALGCEPAALDLRLLAPASDDPTPLRTISRTVFAQRDPVATGDAGARVDQVLALVRSLTAGEGPYMPGLVVVGTARHEGPLGAIALNDALREVANPDGAPTGFTAFGDVPVRVGDPLTVRGNLFRHRLWDAQRALVIGTSREEEGGAPTLLLAGETTREGQPGVRLFELTALDLRACALGYADTLPHLAGAGHAAGAAFRLPDLPDVVLLALEGPRTVAPPAAP